LAIECFRQFDFENERYVIPFGCVPARFSASAKPWPMRSRAAVFRYHRAAAAGCKADPLPLGTTLCKNQMVYQPMSVLAFGKWSNLSSCPAAAVHARFRRGSLWHPSGQVVGGQGSRAV
jgi:hypothetical protein